MHIILGATGHIGSALAKKLLQHGEPVTVVTRNEKKAEEWRHTGAKVAIADVLDTEKLQEIFHQGKKLFLLKGKRMQDVFDRDVILTAFLRFAERGL